jgi:hypothetical protein
LDLLHLSSFFVHRNKRSPNSIYSDFMDGKGPTTAFFGALHVQDRPEFTLRSYENLLRHRKPIPRNLYGFIHGRDIFGRIENFKTFLDDVCQILQPDGVVEFSEVDPRPRLSKSEPNPSNNDPSDHTNGPAFGWTDNVSDRFKNPLDAELATDVESWTKRVNVRLEAALRPADGIPAPSLKDWVEGAG